MLKKEDFEKDLMNLTETNHKININSKHSVLSNRWFKSHLNGISFNIFLTLAVVQSPMILTQSLLQG